MTIRRSHRLAALAAASAALLAVPATAAAHPAVWSATAKVNPATPTSNYGSLADQVRYVVTNHGISVVLRETNGKSGYGVINYAAAPANWRSQVTKAVLYANTNATTGAQPHATCDGVAALTDTTNIGSWQDADPFYAYIPFQKSSAGLDDDPADWIPVVKNLTGVDLNTADPATACAGLGGTYVPADDYNNPPTTANPNAPFEYLSSHTIEHEVAQAKTALQTQIDTLQTARTTAETAQKSAEAKLAVATTPLGVGLPATSFTVKTLTAGIAVKVSGPAGEKSLIRIVLSAAGAKKLGLKYRTLASATTTLAAGGSTVTVKPSAATAAKLTKLTSTDDAKVDVFAGGRMVTTNAKVTK